MRSGLEWAILVVLVLMALVALIALPDWKDR